MKKLVLVLVLVFALAIPALANPFVDVPLNHWAYDAVQTLAAKGVVIGYPDGTFGGQRMLTRYEFAEAVARVLAYVEQYDGLVEDVEILSKLAVEFADELASLGVTVADLEASVGANSEAIAAMKEIVDKHERFFDPVTISGKWKADYSVVVIGDATTPVGTATLTDRAELKFAAEINPETTVDVTLRVDNILGGSPTVTPRKYDLKYAGDWDLWVASDIEPANIALGLIYDFDELEDFAGAWAQWEWDTDEDLGTWTMFMDVDSFYILNVAMNVGDDDDIPIGVTASWDQAAGNALVVGADIAFDLTDEDDDEQIGLALEGAVMTDMVATDFAVAAQLAATLGDEDDIDATLDAWYTTTGFVPTNSAYDPDELGVELGVAFMLTDEEDGDIQISAKPYWGYVMDSAMATNTDHYVGLELNFTNIDEDHPETIGKVSAEYSILNGDIELQARLLDLYLSDDEDIVFNARGKYVLAAVPDYYGMVNVIYNFEDDPMTLIVEGRVDAGSTPFYSAEAQITYDIADNTELNFGVEMNDWDADINDWSDSDEFVINDGLTKIYAGIEVSF